MKRTLLLCFIHGFKGGDDTFGDKYGFTEHLRHLVAKEFPKLDVQVLVYPKFETRGDLGQTVSRFRDWLQNKVIDIEVEHATPSPTVDPSVRTILIGHSMGGVVAAETVIGIASERPIYSEDGIQKSDNPSSFNGLMFPYIQGVLAFDTPYLGISPGVVAHGAEGHYQNAAAAMASLSGLSGLGSSLWGGADNKNKSSSPQSPAGALPPATESKKEGDQGKGSGGAGSGGGWGKWGKMAMYAGAASVVAAGASAAWMNRNQISSGWGWVTSHLEFVNCLARPEELKKRVSYMVRLSGELDVGFANLYTRLGRGAGSKEVSMVGTVLGPDRTFCNLPKTGGGRGDWRAQVNDKASDETVAHMSMFEPKDNPGYEELSQDARGLIVQWTRTWYTSAAEKIEGGPS